MDEFRTICLMPESSIKDLSFDADDWVFLENGQRALLTDARLASERGDLAASMESIQAAIALGTHLQGAESCTLLQNQFGEYILGQARSMVIKSILPNLPSSQTDLAAWETLLNPTVQTPADFARIMRSEWNEMMGNSILPALADPGEIQIPVADADQFLEACTNYYFETVNVNAPLALTDLPTHPDPFFDLSARSWRNRQLIEMLQWFPREDWERQQIRTGLTQAAFAILRSQPVPNDPIYGLPYQWNPETRELSLPQGPKFAHRPNRPIKLPDL